MRVVSGATERSNIALLYDELSWPTLDSRQCNHCLSLQYKIMNDLTPDYLSDLIPQRPGNQEERVLRSQDKKLLPILYTRTDSFRRSFIPFTSRLWNDLDRTIRESPSLEIFKHAISTCVTTGRNKLFYIGKRLPAIHHARLRMGCSKLNMHLCHNLKVIPSPECRCGCPCEDPMHFFFSCPIFYAQ